MRSTGIHQKQVFLQLKKYTTCRSYYADNGLSYNIGRLNMGGCDFSTRPYSYDDIDGDVNLEHFALTEEDTLYKVKGCKEHFLC